MILTFTGDTSITGAFIKKVENEKNIFSTGIINTLEKSDYVVCNLEGAVTKLCPPSSSHVMLKSAINTINYLSERNINVYNLANNHILDCREQGLMDTISTIQKNNCQYFGAGNNISEASKECILIEENISIALFGLTVSDVNKTDKPEKIFTRKHLSILKNKIKDLNETVDYIIINYHGGEEFTNYPSPTKRNFLKKIAKIPGVDIVIAHHSHTFQSFEKYNNTYIFYSLGNFIFDIPAHLPYKYTNESALLKFDFQKNKFTFDFIPFKSENGKISESNLTDFKNYLTKISDFKNYKQNWRAEAYRVLFRFNHIHKIKNKTPEKEKTLQEKSIVELFFSKKFYVKTLQILLSDNYRPLYLSAILHKISLKLRLK